MHSKTNPWVKTSLRKRFTVHCCNPSQKSKSSSLPLYHQKIAVTQRSILSAFSYIHIYIYSHIQTQSSVIVLCLRYVLPLSFSPLSLFVLPIFNSKHPSCGFFTYKTLRKRKENGERTTTTGLDPLPRVRYSWDNLSLIVY